MEELIQSIDGQRIVHSGGKNYLVLPLTDHVVPTHPILVRQAVNALCDQVKWTGKNQPTMVVGEEERGGFIAVCVALQRDLPFSLAKQNPIHIPGEIGIKFKMAYRDDMGLYLNGVSRGDRVVIVDDIVDSGGTMCAMIQALTKAHVTIVDIVALAEKSDLGGVQRIKRETGYGVKTLFKIDTSGTKSRLVYRK